MWEKTGFNGYVCDFSVDYDVTDIDNIVDIYTNISWTKITV